MRNCNFLIETPHMYTYTIYKCRKFVFRIAYYIYKNMFKINKTHFKALFGAEVLKFDIKQFFNSLCFCVPVYVTLYMYPKFHCDSINYGRNIFSLLHMGKIPFS